MKVSVILPTYNESKNILPLIDKIFDAVYDHKGLEIIVVDDNSPDGTYKIVKGRHKKNKHVQCLLRTKNRGFANSIKDGICAASGEVVIVMDTDFTHDPIEIPTMLYLEKKYDLIVGSRFCAGGNMQDKAHYLCSFVFNLLLRVILKTQIQDNLGGFFCVKKSKLKKLPFDKIFYGYGDYFFRLLYYAEKAHISILEIPCKYFDRKTGESKSNWVKMFIKYFVEAIKTRNQGCSS